MWCSFDTVSIQVKKLELIGKANDDQRKQYEETEREIEAEMNQAAETIEKAT